MAMHSDGEELKGMCVAVNKFEIGVSSCLLCPISAKALNEKSRMYQFCRISLKHAGGLNAIETNGFGY